MMENDTAYRPKEKNGDKQEGGELGAVSWFVRSHRAVRGQVFRVVWMWLWLVMRMMVRGQESSVSRAVGGHGDVRADLSDGRLGVLEGSGWGQRRLLLTVASCLIVAATGAVREGGRGSLGKLRRLR
jgi:hypothetical protein